MVSGLQLGSAITDLAAAALWFWSAAGKPPPMTWKGVGHLETFLADAGRLNRWAAGANGVSMVLSAVATLLTAV